MYQNRTIQASPTNVSYLGINVFYNKIDKYSHLFALGNLSYKKMHIPLEGRHYNETVQVYQSDVYYLDKHILQEYW